MVILFPVSVPVELLPNTETILVESTDPGFHHGMIDTSNFAIDDEATVTMECRYVNQGPWQNVKTSSVRKDNNELSYRFAPLATQYGYRIKITLTQGTAKTINQNWFRDAF